MRIRLILCILLVFFLNNFLFSQSPKQVIRGEIFDHYTHQPLPGANIIIYNDHFSMGTTSDSLGTFRLKQVPVGRYELKITYMGYQPEVYQEIELEAAKELVISTGLVEDKRELEEVVISPSGELDPLEPLSHFSYSTEKSERYAATFYDPARLATSFAGVATSFDQANNIIIRGNSPNTLSWRLEGVEIVNPNHLTNAGTFSDRASISGGGVSVLSAQVLDKSEFYTGGYPAEFGNALAGVFDIKLKDGNYESYEHTFQAGLLGLDLGSEGPLTKGGKASYLFNYRYSTIGLLSGLGFDVGEESINFQDLSFNFSFQTKDIGRFNLFGIGGKSAEKYRAPRDSTVWEYAEDRYDVIFTSDMGVIGLKNEASLGEETYLKNVVAYSVIESDRNGDFVDNDYNTINLENDFIKKRLLSYHGSINRKVGHANYLKTGLYFNKVFYEQKSRLNDLQTGFDNVLTDIGDGYNILNSYVSYHAPFFNNLHLNAGIHGIYLTLNNSFSVEPRIFLNWEINSSQSFKVAYGLHSAMQAPNTYFTTIEESNHNQSNVDLGFTKAHHYITGYQRKLSDDLVLKSEIYYQQLFNVPVSKNKGSSFSVLNIMEEYVEEELVNSGKGRNIGIEATIEKYLSNDYYFLLNGSLYDSEYLAADNIWRDTRFNGNYLTSFSGGKQFVTTHEDFQRVINLNVRFLYQGGFRQTPFTDLHSGGHYQNNSTAFSDKLPDYFRIDFQVSFKKNKPDYTRILSLDIQNVLNRRNVAFYYFDTQQNKVVNKYQLGILPFLNYRIEF